MPVSSACGVQLSICMVSKDVRPGRMGRDT